LIETVGSGKPRIDFTDNTDGHLLLEPSRTNLVTYSEDFSQWGLGTRITITSSDIVSPDGSQNADKFVETTNHWAENSFSATSGTSYTISMFAKADERTEAVIYAFGDNGVFNYTSAIYDLENGLVISGSGASIENYGNGWYRCIRTMTSGATATGYYAIGISNNQTIQYVGDTSKGLHIWGAQLESGSYATSYIPTEGSSVTRVAETGIDCLLPNETIINNSTATVYLEFEALVNDLSNRWISFEELGVPTDNMFEIRLSAGSNLLQIVTRSSGGGQDVVMSETLTDITANNKIAVNYNGLNWKLAVNGTIADTETAARLFNDNIEKIKFSRNTNTNHFYGKVKDLRVYNTALTDTELQNLTS
jgi:hypothetical protein